MSDTKWDKFYKQHGRFYLLPHPSFRKVVAEFKKQKVKTVIDLGCGNGRHLVALAEEGFGVSGIDFSPAAVDIAQKWLKERHFEGRVSIADLHDEIKTYKDSSFDAVFAVNSLNYRSSDEFIDTLHEINRLLKTGGLLFLVVPSQQTKEKNPEFVQFYFKEEALRISLEGKFDIIDLDTDDKGNYVVLAQEKKV